MNTDSTFLFDWQHDNYGLTFTLQQDKYITYWAFQQFMVMDSTYTIIDSFSCGNGYITDWHEFLYLENG